MGQVVGATNPRGEYPTTDPVSPQDVLATIYCHLGIDPACQLTDSLGRRIPILPDGAPIRQLL
jgi:hypothetical protein